MARLKVIITMDHLKSRIERVTTVSDEDLFFEKLEMSERRDLASLKAASRSSGIVAIISW